MLTAATRTSRLMAAAAVAVTALASLAACGGGGSTAKDAAANTVSCSYPTSGTAAAKPVDKPPTTAPKDGQVPVTIATSIGTLQATLDSDSAPCTVNSFRSLAKQGYFDATTCHRLTTSGIFVLQCGDPTGTGKGGPGYTFADELTGKETYPAGTLAMANAGPDTNGSQFFVVYRDTQLSADYTVFGSIDAASVKIVQQLASQGTSNGTPDGPPKVPVEISKVS